MKMQLCPEGTHRRPSSRKGSSQKNEEKRKVSGYISMPLETYTPQYFKRPFFIQLKYSLPPGLAQLLPRFFTPKTRATPTFFNKKNPTSCLYFFLRNCPNTGAREESAWQLSTFERHRQCLLPCLFTGKFYSFGSKKIHFRWLIVFLSACWDVRKFYSFFEENRCNLSKRKKKRTESNFCGFIIPRILSLALMQKRKRMRGSSTDQQNDWGQCHGRVSCMARIF